MPLRNSFISKEQLEKVRAHFEKAIPLPAATYYNQDFYDSEREKIFCKHWVPVLFDFDVEKPGQALPFDYLGMPMLAVRGLDNHIRIFHNIVPYDGCLAVLNPVSGLKQIETPYHGWVYDLEGKLLAIPFWDGTPEGNLKSVAKFETDLKEVHCETFLHTVFINLSPEPDAFEEHVAPIRRQFPDYDFENAVIAADEAGRPIVVEAETKCNWKFFFDIDGPNVLHESFVHKDYRNSPLHPRVTKDGKKTYREIIDGYLVGLGFNRSDFVETYGDIDSSKPHLGRDGALPDAAGFVDLYPALSLSTGPDYAEVAINLPNGVDRTTDRRMYLLPAAPSDGAKTNQRESAIDFHSDVAPEDNAISEALQKASHSPAYQERFFSPFWDRMRHQFHKWVATDIL